MIEISTTHLTVYLEPIMFSWSPCILDIWREDDVSTSATIRIIDETVGKQVFYTVDFFPDMSLYHIDISTVLQTMGDNIRVFLSDGESGGTAVIYNINGANGFIQSFGGEYHVRIWEGFDFYYPIFFYSQTTVYYGRVGRPVEIINLTANTSSGYLLTDFYPDRGAGRYFANGIIKNGAYWEEGQWAINVVNECLPKNPILLRWIDNSGLTWYWVFSQVEASTSVAEGTVYGRQASWIDEYANEWEEERNLVVSKSIKVITRNVTPEEYKVVKTLATSSIVDAFDDAAGMWYRVRISIGDFVEQKNNYKDVEYTIELAPTKTQLP